MKRFLSLFLALMMSFALAVPAFADEPTDPDDGNAGIMPLLQVFPDSPAGGRGTYNTARFTTTPSNGNYIQVWYANLATSPARIMLHRVDSGKDEIVSINSNGDKYMTVNSMNNGSFVYSDATAGSGTYYVVIECPGNGIINGRIAVAQYAYNPG